PQASCDDPGASKAEPLVGRSIGGQPARASADQTSPPHDGRTCGQSGGATRVAGRVRGGADARGRSTWPQTRGTAMIAARICQPARVAGDARGTQPRLPFVAIAATTPNGR